MTFSWWENHTEVMDITEKRTAKDPKKFVDELNGIVWGGKTLKVTLVSIDGETASGRKRFTIRIQD